MRTNDEILSDARMLYDLLSQAEELPGPAEMVLAMGGSDLGVADTAAEAFFQREASWLICTGGYGKDTAGVLPQPEAALYARRCAALGVPGGPDHRRGPLHQLRGKPPVCPAAADRAGHPAPHRRHRL